MAKILFVEDEIHFNQRYIELLRDDLQHEVDIAQDGSEALEKLCMEKYDLILLDIMMPQGEKIGQAVNGSQTGIEILRRLRNGAIENADRNIPVIVFSAVAEREDMREIESLDVSDYLKKPVRFDELKIAIETILSH